MLLYDNEGGGWSGAEYIVYSVPVSVSNLIASLTGGSGGPPGGPPSAVTDDYQYSGTDDPNTERSLGYELVAQGALDVGKQTGYASFCVSDGCYVANVSLGG
jgi:hypothetical protein